MITTPRTPGARTPFDPDRMLVRIGEFPKQIRDAWKIANTQEVPLPAPDGVRAVLMLGMGGSAIGADLVAGLVADVCPVPVILHRNYGVPAWVDGSTLVIASSYSGGTEETLSGWMAAGERGARRLAITTGGELADRAASAGEPVIRFDYPAQPRAALGYSFTLLLGVLSRLGLIPDPARELEAALALLDEAHAGWHPAAEPGAGQAGSRPRRLADFLAGGVPVILASDHLAPVARRWTTQINENAKSWAFWNEYPELNHNVIVGLENPEIPAAPGDGTGSGLVRVVHLKSPGCHQRNRRRLEITEGLIRQAGIPMAEASLDSAPGPLAEVLWTTWLGDYVSYHLAEDYGVDPSPVQVIARLKRQLEDLG